MYPPKPNSNGGVFGRLGNMSERIFGKSGKKEVPKLTEEAKRNELREIKPDDIADPDALLDGVDFSVPLDVTDSSSAKKAGEQMARRQTIVDDMLRDFKRASNGKQTREEKWYVAAAFERGNQWVEYDRTLRQLRNRWNDPDAVDYFKTINKIRPLLKKNTSRAMSSDADIDFVPIAPTQINKLAAKQCRQVWQHASGKAFWPDVKDKGVYFGHCYPVFWKVTWDAEAEDDVPEFKIVPPPPMGPDTDGDADASQDATSPAQPLMGGSAPPIPPPTRGPMGGMMAAIAKGREDGQQQFQQAQQAPADDQGEDAGGLNTLQTPQAPSGPAMPPEQPITALPPSLRIVGSKRAEVGMARIEYVPPFEVYPDPNARGWDKIQYVIHARRVPVADVQEMFGGAAYLVKPDKGYGGGTGGMDVNASDSRLAGITGDGRDTTVDGGDYVTLIERFEFKSPKYENGRYSVVADNKLLKHVPIADDEFPNPFVPFGYAREESSIWFSGIVNDMVDSQVAYNMAKSHLLSRLRMDKVTVLAEYGADIKPDDYVGGLDYRKIYHKKGFAATLQVAPNDWDKYLMVMKSSEEELEDMIGLHDNSDGQAESGAESGRAVWLRQQSDNRIVREYTRRLELAEVAVTDRVLSLWGMYAVEPRLIGIDDERTEGDIPIAKLFLPDLLKAAPVTVKVTPGSAMPETPGAEEQQLEDWYKMELFGMPGSPEAAKAFLDSLTTLKSSKITDNVVALLEQQQANAIAAQSGIEQQKAQQAQQQATLETQQKIDLIEAQGRVDAANMAQEYQLKATLPNPAGSTPATPQEIESAKVVADNAISHYKAELDATAAEHSAALDIQTHAATAAIDSHHAMNEKAQEHEHAMEAAQVQGAQQSDMQSKQLNAQKETTKMTVAAKAAQKPKGTASK